MTLREAVRTIIRELADEEIRKIVREILVEELMGDPPRVVAAKKAAATRKANREIPAAAPPEEEGTPSPIRGSKVVPKRAKAFGVAIGDKFKGKKSDAKIRHRTIEIVRLDDRFVYPKILGSAGKNAKAKRISYEHLVGRYDRLV